jgi:hypothetical protein
MVINRPKAAGRVVSLFDFEEAKTNPGDVPMHWYRDQDAPGTPRSRAGFPPWNLAVLRYTDAGALVRRGEGAVQLPTQGGSVSLLLSSGVVPIYPDDDYIISAWIRTEQLQHARASVIARFLDASGKVIADSQVRTPPSLSPGEWTEVTAELRGRWHDASWVQLELVLLQPRELASPEELADPTRIFQQDLAGSAWFDDVAVVQMPRVELRTTAAAGVTHAPAKPVLTVLVRDLSGENMDLSLEVRDHWGVLVDQRRQRVSSGRLQEQWSPNLPRLGWYRASMSLTSGIGRVGVASCDFIWLGEPSKGWTPGTSGDATRFGLESQHWNPVIARDLPGVVGAIGFGSVTFPAWDAGSTISSLLGEAEARVGTISALQAVGATVGLSLPLVPTSLNVQLTDARDDLWRVLSGDEKVWLPFAQPLFETLGATVGRWRVDGLDRVPTPEQSRLVGAAFERHLPSPVLVGAADPWLIGAGGVASVPMDRVIPVPATMTPAAVALAAPGWANATLRSGTRASSIAVLLQRPTTSDDGPEQIAEGVKRAVEIWRASAATPLSIVLEDPWEFSASARAFMLPRPELAAMAATMVQIADRRIVGTLPVAPGVVCYLLAPRPGVPAARGGALVAWNESAPPERAVLEAFLGDPVGMRVLDLFGNARAPTTTPGPAGGRALVREVLTSEPIFIDGVDVQLLRILSSIRFEPPRLEASTKAQELTLVIDNPSASTLAGSITILEPGGFEREGSRRDRAWRISPRVLNLNTQPGETSRLPISVAFSPTAEAGDCEFVLRCVLESGSSAREPIVIRRTVQIGLDNIAVDLRTFARVSTSGATDLVLEATVTNTGTALLTLDLTAFAPDRPRVKAIVKELPPGSQTVRQFVFAAAAADLAGRRLTLSIEDRESSARMNRSIEAR